MSLLRQSAWRIGLFGIAIAALIVLLLVTGTQNETAQPTEALVCEDDATALLSPLFSAAMGDAAVLAMDRTPVMLKDLGGDALTVFVFCSYRCPCSDGYVDRLRELRERFEPRGVAFAAIHANADETIDGMRDYIERKEYPLPVFRDDMAAAADMLYATVTPEVFVFDTRWKLQYHGQIDDDKSGFFVEDESLRMALDTLLAGKVLAAKEKLALGCAIVRDHPLENARN